LESEGKHWVRAYHRRAYYKADGTFVSATEVTAHCQGNPSGFDFWKNKIRDSIPTYWPNKGEKVASWSEEEKERVFEALSEVPSGLWGSYIAGIYRLSRSKDYPNSGSSLRTGDIALYDSAFNSKQDPSLARVLTHELAHEEYQHFSREDLEAYQMATNWVPSFDKSNTFVWSNRRGKDEYVRPDAMIGPEEDFAVNIDSYLFQPRKLKTTVPNAYAWIKNHFGDRFVVRSKK
jgi:hypothetical protein